MHNSYLIGNEVRLSCSIVDSTGAAVTGSTVSVTIKQPDDTQITGTASAGGTAGSFLFDFMPTQAGRHIYYMRANGPAGSSAVNGRFDVEASGV